MTPLPQGPWGAMGAAGSRHVSWKEHGVSAEAESLGLLLSGARGHLGAAPQLSLRGSQPAYASLMPQRVHSKGDGNAPCKGARCLQKDSTSTAYSFGDFREESVLAYAIIFWLLGICKHSHRCQGLALESSLQAFGADEQAALASPAGGAVPCAPRCTFIF